MTYMCLPTAAPASETGKSKIMPAEASSAQTEEADAAAAIEVNDRRLKLLHSVNLWTRCSQVAKDSHVIHMFCWLRCQEGA